MIFTTISGPPAVAVFIVLLLFSDISAALPQASRNSQETPSFISIPLVKRQRFVDMNEVQIQGSSAVIHRQHIKRGVRRLALMSGSPQLSPTFLARMNIKIPQHRSTLPTVLQRRRHHHARTMVDAITHKRALIRSGDSLPMVSSKQDDQASANFPLPDAEFDSGSDSNLDSDSNSDSNSDSHSEVTEAHNPAFSHSVPLDIESCYRSVGTQPQPFRLLVDSGSADMWVGGEQCKGDGGGDCGDHKFLGPRSSSTFNDTGEPWSITYGSGSVSGNLVTDHVKFAGFTLHNHKFGVAWNESQDFTPNEIPLDGVLGCAKSSISIQQTPTLVESLQHAGLIEKPIISYKISRLTDGKNDGELTLGGMDPSKYDASSLVCLKNANPRGFWEASLDSVTVYGKDLGLTNRSCIFDTGTTLFIAPEKDVATIHHAIPGAKFNNNSDSWTVPCTTNASLSLGFGGKHFLIESRDLAFLPVDPKNTTGECTSAIAAGGVTDGPTHWLVSTVTFSCLIGDTFLKNVYLSTNEATDEISIARIAD
ncbi:aspartic peptidase domain-containing protein [Mycena sp. CBHHK59/15]|nr:aspartic peptidase domain-containing protein [Mycena sp. CBHHK59/15]